MAKKLFRYLAACVCALAGAAVLLEEPPQATRHRARQRARVRAIIFFMIDSSQIVLYALKL